MCRRTATATLLSARTATSVRSCACNRTVGMFRFRALRGADQAGVIADDLPPVLLAVHHIGPRRAQRLIEGLGSDWRALLDQDPERAFGTLRGVGPHQAIAAAASWRRLG